MGSPPKAITAFELTNQDGQPFRLSPLRGTPVLAFFGFAHCPDICPMTLGQLQAVVSSPDSTLNQARVVMLSVDGARDAPAALKRDLAPVSPAAARPPSLWAPPRAAPDSPASRQSATRQTRTAPPVLPSRLKTGISAAGRGGRSSGHSAPGSRSTPG
ncbi:MAG: SCO family protein [Gammaproteobacteria bacterium]|nr:SCO family protein [Gammaproteobacteria bacterium]